MPQFKVFISHDRNDSNNVKLLADVLDWNKVKPLVAIPTPEPGLLIWKQKIGGMIEDCDYAVIFYSSTSRTNPHVNQEIGALAILKKRMLVLLDGWYGEKDLTGFLEGVEVVKREAYQQYNTINEVYQLLYKMKFGDLPEEFYGIHQSYGKIYIKKDPVSGKMCYYKMDSATANWEQVGQYPDRY